MGQAYLAPPEDIHVHSTFSTGASTLEENVEMAVERRLARLGCVDRVSKRTTWVPEFVAAVRSIRERTSVELWCGVEGMLLDEAGHLDLPGHLDGVDRVYVADHRFPFGGECFEVDEIRLWRAEGRVSDWELVDALVAATINAMRRYPRLVLAQLFSILPKVGLSEASVPASRLEALAHTARATSTPVEITERWRCPSVRALHAFRSAGVPILLGTDAHHAGDIGVYDYVHGAVFDLDAAAA